MKKTILAILLFLQTPGVLAHEAHGKQDPLSEAMAQGKLAIRQHVQTPLGAAHRLSVLTVELAPGFREPAHTHPGEEVLYVVSGRGHVWQNGEATPLVPGEVVHVKQGVEKALENTDNREPLIVIAYLALEEGKAPLDIVSTSE